MSPDPPLPAVPDDRLRAGGWELVDESVETVFTLPTASVEGATVLYDDAETRSTAVRAADIDRQWRFFFATRLTFRPPLAPGVGPAMILPAVRSEATSAFAEELRDRGFENVERGRRERVRTDSGDRARLQSYSASLELEDAGATLSVTGWLGVWNADGFRIAAGAYPDRPVAEILTIDEPAETLQRTARDYRDELLSLIRAVE